MSRYTCTSCQKIFEHQGGLLRCPDCLRQHGLEPAAAPERRPRARRRLGRPVLIAALALALLLSIALLWLRQAQDLPRPGQIAPLPAARLAATLAQRGVPEPLRVDPFAADEPLQALGRSLRAQAPQARAEALVAKLAARLSRAQADLLAADVRSVRSPAALWQALAPAAGGKKNSTAAKAAPGGAPRVLSYELAALLTSLLRAADLTAVLAVAQELPGQMTTPDVDGVGRYLAVVYRPGQLGQKPLLLLDPLRALALPPWAGPGGEARMIAKETSFRPLDDAAAAGHLLALRALTQAAEEPATAYQLSEAALQAAQAADATLLLLRARVLAAAGGLQDALTAAQSALRLGQTASRLTSVAELKLASGTSLTQAASLLEQALALDKGYWPAHRLLASLRWGTEPDKARAHLQAALALAPDEPSVLVLAALDQLGQDERPAAIAALERALAARMDQRVGLLLYQTLRAAGQEQRAATLRQRLLAQAKAPQELTELFELLDQEQGSEPHAPPPAPPALPRGEPPRVTLPDVSLGR